MKSSISIVHLGKEWREQRRTLLVLALLLPAALVPAFALEPALLDDARFAVLCAALAGLAGLLTLAGDLVAGERARGGLAWLERLPAGPAHAFRAKLLLLAGATLALVAYGLALAAGAGWIAGEGVAVAAPGQLAWLAAAAAPLVAWSLACSAWVPHGALALPLALLVVGTLGLPYERLLWHPDYRPPAPELLLLAAAATLAGALAARSAFGHAARPAGARGRLAHAARLAGLALLGFAPAWAWTAVRLDQRVSIDPWSEDFRIDDVHLTEDGSVALVTASQDQDRWEEVPTHVLRVELATGAWEDLGTWIRVTTLLEGRAGTEWDLHATELHLMGDDGQGRAFSAADGRALPADEAAASIEPFRGHRSAGLGWSFWESGRQVYADPFRDRLYRAADLFPEEESMADSFLSLLIGPRGWLLEVDQDLREGPGAIDWRWVRFDPETGATTPTGWPRDLGYSTPMLADGRVVLLLEEGLALGDPVTLALEPLTVDPSLLPMPNLHCAYRGRDGFIGSEPILLDVGGALALLDLERGHVRDLATYVWYGYVDSLDERTALIEQEGRLVALDVESGERRVLFPRGDAPELVAARR